MHMSDRNTGQPCRVIPFIRPTPQEDQLITSDIAAVITVTVLHYESDSPETRLLEIIESSGIAEVFEINDAVEYFEKFENNETSFSHALNDNDPIVSV